jgi:hypothetical protein
MTSNAVSASVCEGGSKKYVVHYRQAGIQRRHTIGSVANLTLVEARKRARKILVAVDDGRDPAAEKESKRAASGLVFAAVMGDYLDVCERTLKPKTVVGYKGDLKRLWKPLHKLALGAVSRPVIAAHLRTIAEESGSASANRARGTLSSFYVGQLGKSLRDQSRHWHEYIRHKAARPGAVRCRAGGNLEGCAG